MLTTKVQGKTVTLSTTIKVEVQLSIKSKLKSMSKAADMRCLAVCFFEREITEFEFEVR